MVFPLCGYGGYFVKGNVAMGTALEDKIAAAEAKLKQLKAEQAKIEAAKKLAEAKRRRQDETRRKILVGAVILARVDSGRLPLAELTEMMDKALVRKEDRALFELPALPETDVGVVAPELLPGYDPS
jgi:hypothetical protein